MADEQSPLDAERPPSVRRLGRGDRHLARQMFVLVVDVFQQTAGTLSDDYVDALLADPNFWALAAVADGSVAGGLTAHTLPMTSSERSEVFIFDIAVAPDHQRRGVGRRLVSALIEAAAAMGIDTVFVPADDEDTPALDFYRALGGTASAVTIFEFDASRRD